MTLHRRYGHLLNKRASPNFLDAHKNEILRLLKIDLLTRGEIAQRFGTSHMTVTKAIRRWKVQDATLDAPVCRPKHRQRREQQRARMALGTA